MHLAEAHLQRLQAAAPTAAWLPAAFAEATRAFGPEATGLLRLAVDPREARLLARLEPLTPLPTPYRLRPLPHPLPPRTGGRHKGLDGPWSQTLLAQVRQGGAEDALLVWPDGTLAETALAAVVLVVGGEARVPPRDGRVISLGESHLLPDWARGRGLGVREARLGVEDLPSGTLWCLNAVRGLWQAEILLPLPSMAP